MKIEEIKAGILVIVSNPIEKEIDGLERRKGAIGMVDSPVFGGGGVWWWIIHRDGSQMKYRFCEISEIKTIRVEKKEEADDDASEQAVEEEIDAIIEEEIDIIEADPFILER